MAGTETFKCLINLIGFFFSIIILLCSVWPNGPHCHLLFEAFPEFIQEWKSCSCPVFGPPPHPSLGYWMVSIIRQQFISSLCWWDLHTSSSIPHHVKVKDKSVGHMIDQDAFVAAILSQWWTCTAMYSLCTLCNWILLSANNLCINTTEVGYRPQEMGW